MKLHYLLLPAALLFAACGNGELEGVQPNLPITGPSTLLATATPIFPEADSSVQLSANEAEGVMQLLKSIDPKKALNLNEQDITDAEYKEIKRYVTENLKAENDYQTYKNIYNWLIKNIKYPWGANDVPYLRPYDIFKHKCCVCQGYANLLKTMCHTQGIPCACVNGDLVPLGAHAWNYVYVDGDWYVSDATNGHDYKAADLSSYENSLIPQRMDFVVLEDDKCEYTYENRYLNVKSIKPTTSTSFTVPYSVNGLRVMSFIPSEELPKSITQLNIGSNIVSFGEYDPTSSLSRALANVEEINVDPKNYGFESYKGVVYSIYDKNRPYLIPAGIRSLTLRPLERLDKNMVAHLYNLEELVIGEGTKYIDDFAVERCPNLKRIYVPETVISISENAFYECGNFEIFKVPTSIHEITM